MPGRMSRFLRSFDLKAIVIACGTVSTTSLDTLRAENDLPMCRRGGAHLPARHWLVTKNKKIGMIATLASVRSGAYEANSAAAWTPAVEVVSKPCPLFVPLVENGRIRPGRRGDRDGGPGVSGAAEGQPGWIP